MHTNWRDCAAWRDENLPMSTTSNEACKLYDVCLSQFSGYYENHQFGGLVNSMNKMIEADPDFILGHCLKNGIEIIGTSSALTSTTCKQTIKDLVSKSQVLSDTLTQREKQHVTAVEQLQLGDLSKCINTWEDILVEYPTDMMAVRILQSLYFYTGRSTEMRDSVARVFPKWKSAIPLHSYLYGFYAFGLTQNNQLDKAEKYALKAIGLNSQDGWAHHAIAHANEYRGSYQNGIDYMLKNEDLWKTCDFIRSHNYWHLCLFYLENQDYEKIVDIFEQNEAFKNPTTAIDMINASSLLMRLKLDGFKNTGFLEDKFCEYKQKFNDRLTQHGYPYSDSHMSILYSMCGTDEEKKVFMESLKEFINDPSLSDFIRKLNSEISDVLFRAIFYYGENEFDKAVDLLHPIRYDINRIGGSNAQRDIFNLILIDSCFRSNEDRNKRLGEALYFERISQKENSSVTRRIADRFLLNENYETL